MTNSSCALCSDYFCPVPYHRYIQEHEELDLYGTKRLEVPVPDCNLIYTGRKRHVPKVLSLGREIFGDDSPVDLKVRVVSEPGHTDIIGQYIRFCHVLDDNVREYGRTGKAVERTILACRKENVLSSYLAEREKEVWDIMTTLFSQEEAMKRYGYSCREEGMEKGLEKGLKDKTLLVVKNMLKKRYPYEEIAQLADAPVEEVERIAKESGLAY